MGYGKMKKSMWFNLIFVTTLLLSCSSQPHQVSQSTVIPPTQTTQFLDFDHPRLHEIAGDKSLVIDEIARWKPYTGNEYVAVIVETNDDIYRQEMLVFQITDNTSKLIYDLGPFLYMTLNLESNLFPIWLYNNYFVKGSHGFGYFNADGPLMLPVIISMGGNCYDCATMKLIAITDKGNAIDVTPATDFNPQGFVELNGHGLIRVVATRYYEFDYGACDHVSSPFAFRIFKWQESNYIDVSKDEKEFYDQKISELITGLKEIYSGPLHSCWVMPTLANIFFDYESSGRVEYGWEQIQELGDLSHWDIQNTPPEEIQTYHDVFNQLEQRKNEDLATATP